MENPERHKVKCLEEENSQDRREVKIYLLCERDAGFSQQQDWLTDTQAGI